LLWVNADPPTLTVVASKQERLNATQRRSHKVPEAAEEVDLCNGQPVQRQPLRGSMVERRPLSCQAAERLNMLGMIETDQSWRTLRRTP
jgi:hypothetical protein